MKFHNFMTLKQSDLQSKLGELMWENEPKDRKQRRLELLGGGGGDDGTSGLLCESDDNPKNYLTSTDACVTCEDYTYADKVNDQCISDTCSADDARIILAISGNCETCQDYFKPNTDKNACVQDTCTST
jgi:hypothetical protein